MTPSPHADPRALRLLLELRARQQGLSRSTALAWERAVFCECFSDPEPARRVQGFLGRKLEAP